MAKVKPIPEGYRNVTPYLFVKGADRAIEFYKNVFGATERMRLPGTHGEILHAEIKIGDSIVMLADENLQIGVQSPQTLGGTSGSLHVYLENVDAVADQAVAAGAKLVRPVQDQFYGDRSCTLIDPFGQMWSLATHIEDVDPEELPRRLASTMSKVPPT